MSQSLTLNISKEVYRYLLKVAEQTGQIPEVIAAQWLSLFTRKAEEDPVERFIGSLFKSKQADWTDRHDEYLGQFQNADVQLSD